MAIDRISRRHVLAAVPAGLFVGAVLGENFHRTSLNLDNDADAFLAYLKMRGSFSSDPMYWWYKSLTYGVVDRQVTLLYALEIASWSRSELNDDGTMTTTASEVGYYLSPEDGRVLENVTNPYTGKPIRLCHIKGGPRQFLLTPKGMKLVKGMPAGTEFSISFRQPFVVNETVYMSEETHGAIPSQVKDADGQDVDWPFRTDEFTTYSAPLAELNDAAVPTAKSTRFTFQNMMNWPVWMEMGTRPGFTMGRGQGGRIKSFDDLPASIKEPVMERDPLFYKNPESWSKPEKHLSIFGQKQ